MICCCIISTTNYRKVQLSGNFDGSEAIKIKAEEKLGIWALTNIDVDKDAKRYWRCINRNGAPPIEHSKEDCMLWRICIDSKTITKKIPTCIYNEQPQLDSKSQEILEATI